MTKPRLKQFLIGFAKLAISLGLLVWFVQTGKLPLQEMKVLLDPQTFALGMLLTGLVMLFSSERWRFILHSQGFKVPMLPTLRMSLIGTFFSTFMPGGVGGDLVKGFYVVQNTSSKKAQAVASVIFDRILGLYTMVMIAFFACLIEYDVLLHHPILKSFFLGLCVLVFIFTMTFFSLWSRRMTKFRDFILEKVESVAFLHRNLSRLNQFKLNKTQFAAICFLSVLAQAAMFTFFVVIASLIGFGDIPIGVFLFVVPLGFIATAIPISPGGIGVGQAAFYLLFNIVLGRETQVGSILITAFQIFTLLYGLLGAVFYVFLRQHMPLNESAEAS